VVVTTPQDVALIDARKGLAMFRKVNVPVLGIVENMSYFICRHCGEREEIFGHGGGRKTAEMLGVPFLGEVPIDPKVVVGGDTGEPIVAVRSRIPRVMAFKELARQVVTRCSPAWPGTRTTRMITTMTPKSTTSTAQRALRARTAATNRAASALEKSLRISVPFTFSSANTGLFWSLTIRSTPSR
jgi:hypothetical protein